MSNEIEIFNKRAIDYIESHGTLRLIKNDKTLLIEREDNQYVGWFEGEDHTETLGKTPYEVYCDA